MTKTLILRMIVCTNLSLFPEPVTCTHLAIYIYKKIHEGTTACSLTLNHIVVGHLKNKCGIKTFHSKILEEKKAKE